jgi:hypothetical protein
MVFAVTWSHIQQLVGRPVRSTRMINAAVVNGTRKDVALDAFVVDL